MFAHPKPIGARDLGQLRISIANTFGTDQGIDKLKTAYQLRSLPRSMKKNGELWSTNKIVYAANFYIPKMNKMNYTLCRLMQLHAQVAFLEAKFQPLNCLRVGHAAPGGLRLGSAPYF